MAEEEAPGVVYKYLDGKREEEPWCARAGLVRVTYPNGDTFQGYLSSQRVREGRGKYVYAAGSGEDEEEGGLSAQCVYDGEWRNNEKYGFGEMKYGNGDVYQGTWVANKRNGHGTFTFANGDVYSGEWLNDVKNGQGAYVFAKPSSQLLGTWKNGECVRGKWVLPDETSYHGQFNKGKPVDNGIFYFTSGLTQEGSFVQSRVEDEEEQTEESAETAERTFIRGKIGVALGGVSEIVVQPACNNNAQAETDEDFVLSTKPRQVTKKAQEEKGKDEPLAEDDPRRDTAAEVDAIELLFNAVDQNSDGNVDLMELVAAVDSAKDDPKYATLIQSTPELCNHEYHTFFQELDENKDGRLNLAEFKEYFYILKLFHFVDADSSGKVRHGELRTALLKHPEIFPKDFSEVGTSRIAVSALLNAGDLDQDKLLTFHEFVHMIIVVTKNGDDEE